MKFTKICANLCGKREASPSVEAITLHGISEQVGPESEFRFVCNSDEPDEYEDSSCPRLLKNKVPMPRENGRLLADICTEYGAQELVFLGEGSFGQVFELKQSDLMPEALATVVKVQKARSVSEGKCLRLRLEVEYELGMLQKLRHPNIIRHLGESSYRWNGCKHDLPAYRAIHFEKCSMPLSSYIKVSGFKCQQELVQLYRQTTGAVEYMHSQCIVHHDIKPGNIMIQTVGGLDPAEFTYKIIDLGLASHYPESALKETQEVRRMGTNFFKSPEKLTRERKPYNPYLCDVYALGKSILICCVGMKLAKRFVTPVTEQLETFDVLMKRMEWVSQEMKATINSMVQDRPEDRPFMHELPQF